MEANIIGKMGEEHFSLLCSSVGLVKNKAFEDESGWDFLVEVPVESVTESRQDLTEQALEFKVQVKSTYSSKKKVQVKLSNIQKHIFTPYPVFFCFFEFDNNRQLLGVYLVHFGKKLIYQGLKRLRQLKQKSDLNKQSMVIKYSDENRLENQTGEALLKGLKKYLGRRPFEYISRKTELINKAGYENGESIISFVTFSPEEERDLVKLSLGLISELKINSVKGVKQRFGIKEDTPFFSEESAIMEMPNLHPSANAMLTFRSSDFSKNISHEVGVYVSQFSDFEKNINAIILYKGDFFNFVVDHNLKEAQFDFEFDFEKKYSMLELKKLIQTIKFLNEVKHGLLIDIKYDQSDSVLSYPLGLKDQLNTEWSKNYEDFTLLKNMLDTFDLDYEIKISIREFLEIQEKLKLFQGFSHEKIKKTRASFRNIEDLSDKKFKLILLMYVEIDEYIFGFTYESICTNLNTKKREKYYDYFLDMTMKESGKYSIEKKTVYINRFIDYIEGLVDSAKSEADIVELQPPNIISELSKLAEVPIKSKYRLYSNN